MISKGDWGSGYLAGTGISLVAVLIFWFVIRPEPDFSAFVGTVTGIILSLALVYLAIWLRQSRLQDDHIWAVARWAAIGLAIPTIPLGAVVLFRLDFTPYVESSVLVNVAASSAVVGALFGAVTELEEEQRRIRALNRRNAVLNRVLRHDVLNDAGLLLLFAERLENESDSKPEELAEPIRAKTEEIIELSRTAKRIESLDLEFERQPKNVVAIVEEQVKTVRRTRPEVEIETDLPGEAWVTADDLLKTVIDNIIENAIQHTDRQPRLRVTVRGSASRSGHVEICVADNGPGMPTRTAEMLSRGEVSDPLEGTPDIGLGLCLVKWFVEAYDGDITIEDRNPRGTAVRISLPRGVPLPGQAI